MKSNEQNPISDRARWSQEQILQAFLFWFFWSAYLCLAAILIAALLTDWPGYLHAADPFGR